MPDQPVAAEEASGVVGREELVSAPAQQVCEMYTWIVPSGFSRTVSGYRYARAGIETGRSVSLSQILHSDNISAHKPQRVII